MMRQYELVETVKQYDPSADEQAINRAYVFSMKAHGAQKRASGDPYFSHPVEVAGILTHYRLDGASIITALLHDTVEDTRATLPEIEDLFGTEIAKLVDGVTKLSQLEITGSEARQAENFRKLLLAMSEDLRVLLVKLADRLHNMRTLDHIRDREKRKRIASETLEIYSPLAERIGMRELQDELEDLAFAHINPDARTSIMKRLEFLRTAGESLVPRIIDSLSRTLEDAGLKPDVGGREKSPYSIWRKMQRKDVEFEQLSDIMAFRVQVGTIEECYRALGAIHGAWRVSPGRFKDYISLPKPNGYRSIHTAVIGPDGYRIEIQIRTGEMHNLAENGLAAHWSYKQKAANGRGEADTPQYRWLRELLDIMEQAEGPDEFLEHTKLEMFRDQVFCFTPRGDLIALPHGATPVDFAYAVHSEVGDRCTGVKVNGRMVPLQTGLVNGDQVEVLTSKSQKPSPDWLRFVATGKARARIRRFIRIQHRHEYRELGRGILDKAFRQENRRLTKKAIARAVEIFQVQDEDDLLIRIGEGRLSGPEVVNKLFPAGADGSEPGKVRKQTARRKKGNGAASAETGISIRGLIPGMAVHYARCCHPLPGERIVGIVTTGKGVTVHTVDCDTLQRFNSMPSHWLDLSWDVDGSPEESHIARIKVFLSNEPGTLGDLSTIIGKNGGNITNLRIANRSIDFFEIHLDIQVDDVRHLTEIIAALRASPIITSVDRARG
ncbi:MAG: bifunctional (p)ppGpp synthetase/guanosine-3',5'-bis(diphosphate) 3'-pyrophosphohydrolase [Rhodospirillaceae bacterium]|nr:bifunctional (p)ppGpp synthetase/guanosine-3',5'-bis(diphosphate) 3'-pyrophosphohydrolase [Rhodospirillaceae bacterium]